ncbi:MAG TPA: tetratricopeptide repeat protein [Candidatus Cloacimonas sp.]|nr:tetratricopeptide repeat protein [Candidatus Cloacimonas sp.]
MKCRVIIICLLCLIGLFACEVNTMYNARNYFKSAQSKPLNSNGRPNAQAIDEYTKAIKKCGKIIATDKKGKRVEEAYYLMAKSLYYKGNSAFQAKDQFQNLVIRFPDSKYVPEAYIYIAKILRETNQPKEAEKLLDEFLRNPKYRKHHPMALSVLADFAIQDKDYIKAQHYLERIINEFPKTKEYREAYFLFGKNYYEQKDFAKSLEAFKKMQNARGIDKAKKLDGTYYIGLNELELGEAEKALKTAKGLLKAESRPDKLPFVRLLKARAQFALGDTTAARSEIELINKNYPRTAGSAGGYYYLAEHYYYNQGDIHKAIASYNRVRTEFSSSPLAASAQAKSSALGLVSPRQGLDCEKNLSNFLDYQYQAAESFLNVLALPDSAIARYRIVIAQKDILVNRCDSLLALISKNNAILDSLRAIVPIQEISEEDSIGIVDKTELLTQLDDLLDVSTFTDSLSNTADSLKITKPEIAAEDSLLKDNIIAIQDSSSNQIDTLVVSIRSEITRLEQENELCQDRINTLEEIIERFDSEIIPFCLFAIGSIYHNNYPESPENAEILTQMQEQYPENKFTKALYALQNDLPVRLIDPLEEREEQLLELYLEQIYTAPDSALVGLEELTRSRYPKIKLAANYRLGWFYSFEQVDTLLAKPYLNAVLEEPEAGEYATITQRFFNGDIFLLRGAPKFDIPVADSTVVDSTSLNINENKKELPLPEGAEIHKSLSDSLKIYNEIPVLVDTLAKIIPPVENKQEEDISSLETETPEVNTPEPEENPVPTLPEESVPEKKEEIPLE